MAEVTVKTAEIELKTARLTKSILKQMRAVETFSKDYLPGGKEAQDEKYKVIGWVHGSVLESDETHWHWLIVQLRPGEFVRLMVERDRLERMGLYQSGQVYIV
jgi:hypothetical protein